MTTTRRVLITGCSSGFGRLLVPAFLARGWEVVATLRRADERAGLFEAERAQHGARLELASLDVTDADARARVVEAAGGRPLHALVNNAGYGQLGALEDLCDDDLRRQLDTNVLGAAALTRGLLPALRDGRGALVFVSSIMGRAGYPLSSAYCASKFALEGLGEALFHELRPHGVRVHLVEPGAHRTGFGDGARWGAGAVPAYAGQTRGFRAFLARLRAGPGNPPDPVVRAIVRACERPSGRLRLPIGRDARFTRLLGALPDRLRLWVFARVFARALRDPGA